MVLIAAFGIFIAMLTVVAPSALLGPSFMLLDKLLLFILFIFRSPLSGPGTGRDCGSTLQRPSQILLRRKRPLVSRPGANVIKLFTAVI